MQPDDAPDQISASARGWHRIQLAVLGFVGLCGVLWSNGDHTAPQPLQWLAAALVVVALALACVAIYLVGRIAHPFSDATAEPPATTARRLRAGVLTTYVAVGVLVVATLTGWWPSTTTTNTVEVRGAAGETWCGELSTAPDGAVRLNTDSGMLTLALDRIRSLNPTAGC